MKYGKKTFFTLVIVFLVFINAASVLFVFMSAKNNERIQKETYKNEYIKIANKVEKNYEKISEYYSQNAGDALFKSVVNQYAEQNICVEIRNQVGMLLFSNFFEPQEDVKNNCVEMIEIESRRHVVVSSKICGDRYQMILGFDVEDSFKGLVFINTVVLTVSVVMSLGFVILVYLMFKRQSKLLEATLADINRIASGDFSQSFGGERVKEYRDFAAGFDLMCQKVNDSVESAKKEARVNRALVNMTANTILPPLESIQRTAYDLLNYSELGEKDQKQVKYVYKEALRVGKNAGRVLELCDIESKPLTFSDVEIEPILSDISYSFSRKVKDVGVQIEVIPTSLVLKGDSDLFSSLFYELCAVSVNSCRSGSWVTLSTNENTVIIRNDNASIRSDDIQKLASIFESGEYDPNASMISHLGFELCKQILAVHKAQIRFEYHNGLVISVTV